VSTKEVTTKTKTTDSSEINNMNANRCVLAYSGGLDTSAILYWLQDQGYEVHVVLVDVGQNEDLDALCGKALRHGAASAVVRDAKPAMLKHIIPYCVGLNATYEGTYRLGTALARPFIALEQVRRARELGGATLVHGATGKGNDQIRFEFAYRSLAPDYPIVAPWKIWSYSGRQDLVDYLNEKGSTDAFDANKTYSLDENFWHLSVEGGPLEDPASMLDLDPILAGVDHHFAQHDDEGPSLTIDGAVKITFDNGQPVAINDNPLAPGDAINALNKAFRHAEWAWDLVIENRFTGVKSRGVYINPAAKLLHTAVDALARCAFNKPTYDQYAKLGADYGAILYRGEYFTDQRVTLEAAAHPLLKRLTGSVTVQLKPTPYVANIDLAENLFSSKLATFEASDYNHADANGFIRLTWLSTVGRAFNFTEELHDAGRLQHLQTNDPLAQRHGASPDLSGVEPLPDRGLVSTAV
jgi:argininosuccinate synthase